MPLTRQQKKRIYEEELERYKARKRIEANQKKQPASAILMNLVIGLGFVLMLYIMLGGK